MSFLVESSGSFMYKIISSENKDIWLLPFLCVSTLSSCYSSQDFKYATEQRRSECTFFCSWGKRWCWFFFPFGMITAAVCYILPLLCWGMSLISLVSPILFTMKECWIRSKLFSISIEMMLWFRSLSLFVWKVAYIDSNERLGARNELALWQLLAREILDSQTL